MIKRLLIGIFSAVLLVVAVSGCNTVRGAGEDVESIGAAVAGVGGGGD
jgi:predicted small secreted protein